MARKAEIKLIYNDNGILIKKECTKCHRLLDVDCFSKDKRKEGRLRTNCKSCINERTNKRRREKEEGIYVYKYNIGENLRKFDTEGNIICKRCSDCKNMLSIDNFNKSNIRDDGYTGICRKCEKKRKKEKKNKLVQQALKDIRLIVESNPTKYDYIPGMNIYGIIYLVYNRITKRYYVGQTTVSFDLRYEKGFFKYHIDDKENSDLHGYPNELLQQDLELYGEESFEFNKIFKVASNQYELDKIEAYWIDKLEAYTKGYNRRRGNLFTNRGLEDKEE